MLTPVVRRLMVIALLAAAGAAHADPDPSVAEVYAAARAGHQKQAQEMIQQVLRNHPQSAKALFVAAELDAKAGELAKARRELLAAQELAPGLPFADARSVQALEGQLSTTARVTGEGAAHPAWRFVGWIVVAFVAGWLVLAVIGRRRPPPGEVPAGAAPPAPPNPSAPANAAGIPPAAAPGGSGILGSLATGVAVGAGVAAGEELVHHVLDGSHHEPASGGTSPPNPDLGGSDFGVKEPGSWDDSDGSSGGGGGDDWT